jgi:RNA polymerase sigma-B factor
MATATASMRDQLRTRSAPRGSHAERRRDEELLVRFASTRSPELRERLVERFMPLARSLARRYSRRSEPLDDLVQVASLGLLKAIDRFDPDRGRPFPAFATPTILGELRRHFRDRVWNLRLPRGLGELIMEVDKATAALSDELGRSPTAGEVAKRLDVETEEVLEAIESAHARATVSLDGPRPTEDGAVAVSEIIGQIESGYERVEASMATERADLDPRQYRVLQMRFVDGLTQRQVGDAIGVSQMQVSRIQRQALWKLLRAVRGEQAGSKCPADAERPREPERGPYPQ